MLEFSESIKRVGEECVCVRVRQKSPSLGHPNPECLLSAGNGVGVCVWRCVLGARL